MMVQLTPVEVLIGLGIVVALFAMWRASARAAHRASEATRAGVRLMSLTGRVLLTAAAIVGVQWIVIVNPGNTMLLLSVLAVPALLASYTLTRALTVTTLDAPRRRSRRR